MQPKPGYKKQQAMTGILPTGLNSPVTQEQLRLASQALVHADLARVLNDVSTDHERHSARMNAKLDQAAGVNNAIDPTNQTNPDAGDGGDAMGMNKSVSDDTMGGINMPMNSPTIVHQYFTEPTAAQVPPPPPPAPPSPTPMPTPQPTPTPAPIVNNNPTPPWAKLAMTTIMAIAIVIAARSIKSNQTPPAPTPTPTPAPVPAFVDGDIHIK